MNADVRDAIAKRGMQTGAETATQDDDGIVFVGSGADRLSHTAPQGAPEVTPTKCSGRPSRRACCMITFLSST